MNSTSLRPVGTIIVFACLSFSYSQPLPAANPGIYKTINELKAGKPSLPLSYPEVQEKVRLGVYGLGKHFLTFSKLQITRRQAKDLDRVIAFSDSLDTYIKVNKLKVHKISRFAKTETIGNYLYYHDVTYNTTQGKGSGLVWWILPVERLYNLNSGKRITLNRKNLKKILTSKPALWDSFKQEKNKAARLKDYLIKYYQD